jgi:hypothetical protein
MKRGRPSDIERMKRMISEIHDEQFDEDTAPADIGDIIELLKLMIDYIARLEKKING